MKITEKVICKPGPLDFELLVLRRGELRLAAMRQHLRLDEPPDIEVEPAEPAEADEGTDPFLLIVGHDDDFAIRARRSASSPTSSKPSAKASPVRASMLPLLSRTAASVSRASKPGWSAPAPDLAG
jgi:hypothetical protein